jgi:hypothetical protein
MLSGRAGALRKRQWRVVVLDQGFRGQKFQMINLMSKQVNPSAAVKTTISIEFGAR